MATKTLLSLEQFEQLPEDDNFYELDRGELITLAPAGGMHGMVEDQVSRLLHKFLETKELGGLLPSDTGFVLERDPAVVRCPDVAFLRTEKVEAIPEEGFIQGPPDLAVEIVSPSESATAVGRKIRQYLEAGCQTVWVVYRKTREVHVYEAGKTPRFLSEEDSLEAQRLLPGFSVKVGDLFPTRSN
ncbi:MAG: Uma2 family endonuclease [bacterium]|nr:Uma2 family endonuclease [bacterium]